MKSLMSIALLVVTLVFLLPAVRGATTLGYCAGVMNTAGYYELNQTVLDTGTNCFLFNTSDIHFDCKGFTVDAQGSDSGSAFNIAGTGRTNITVRNCHAEDYDVAYYFQNTDGGGLYDSTSNSANENGIKFSGSSANLMFQNITITDCCANEEGIDTYGSGANTFYNIVVDGSQGHGINVRSANNNFTNVVVTDFTWRGIFFPTGGTNGTFTNIEIYGSGSVYEGMKLQQGNGANTFNGLSIHNIDTTGMRLETSNNVFNNINISYNDGDGIYADECDNCNITGAYIIENDGEGIYWRDNDNTNLKNIVSIDNTNDAIEFRTSTNSYIYNVTSTGDSNIISLSTSSNGNTIDLLTSTGCTADRCVGVTTSDNNVFSNVHASDGERYGVSITGTGNSVTDSSFTNFSQSDFKSTSASCDAVNFTNVTVTGGYQLIHHVSESAYSLNDTTFSQAFICNANSVTLDNVTQIGNDNNGLWLVNVNSSTISDSSFTDYFEMTVSNVTIEVTDTTFTNQDSRGAFTIGGASTFNLTNITLSNTATYGVSLSADTSGEIWDSSLFGNTSALRLTNYNGNVSVDVYDSNINRTQNGSDNGAIRLYCSAFIPPTYNCTDTNTANLFNTVLKDYSVTNSTLNIYWYLDVSNPLGATVVLKDAFDTTVDTFTDTSKSFALLQYVVTPTDNQTTYTPHSLDMSRDGYASRSVYVTMNESGSYSVSLALIGGIRGTLQQAGSGIGGFLVGITDPTVNIVFALGVLGGLLALFYAIASVIKRAVGGATTTI